MLPRIREHVRVPVGVGFGIRDAATARAVGAVADAVVIGTRLVQLLEAAPRERVAQVGAQFIAEMRTALDLIDQGATA
jgi:tryptophan synthase alpha chain